MKITKEMTIEEVVTRYPETIQVFQNYGIACLDCSAAPYDNVEQGAQVHGVDPDQLVRDLNATIGTLN
ncbi:MAG: DUF1858 domain-containing protein [candidate division NC10 bacterium]|nr:DUF1858 domain-containing protein [candidate division NC10 bacterium]